ncbi:hypothetical protein KP004_07250 [Geomonas oryzisoli]|uniref:Uncharacterized protein n=1 Tax=Geomonas oryzisoli TaxID=2847992 RepID=A0ABX8JB01_9BACT|nr:hypothetical protein [Geomonas oryzisoli]QWV94963.1 hypothetical protein KP004_07250 [Geomonas oryzisoli]
MVPGQEKQVSKLRRPFVVVGAVVGAVLSGWYLYDSFGRRSISADPIWTRFVNVALIMFVAIFLANLVRRGVESFTKR